MLNKLLCLPYDDWMKEFLPPQDNDAEIDNKTFRGLFNRVPLKGKEDKMYEPFVKAVNGARILGDFVLAKTYSRSDPTDQDGLKVDGGMYPPDSPAVTEGRTDWASVEVFIECKPNTAHDPYDETMKTGFPFAEARREALGQVMTYANAVFKHQQPTHHFGVVVLGSWARLGRWDRSGVVFSSKFNYRKEPAKLVRFFWRVAHATAEARGHDPTATRVTEGSEDYEILKKWAAKAEDFAKDPSLAKAKYVEKRFVDSLNDKLPWWRLRLDDLLHGVKEFLVGSPTFSAPGVIGRGTRGYIAMCISDPGTPFVYLKDCWRVVHERSELEGDILSYLNEKQVSNVPTVLYHGDVGTQRTLSQKFWKSPASAQAAKPAEKKKQTGSEASTPNGPERNEKEDTKKDKCPMKMHQHYRLVVREVGIPLKDFPTGDILVAAIVDAILAHEEAFKNAQIIHRDISVGNILILPGSDGTIDGYRGLLADWELSKRREDEEKEPRHPDRTGTWQFMSVCTLERPEAPVQIADELESFLHVMIYCAIRYLPHTCRDVGDFMYAFFDDGIRKQESEYTCGPLKHSVLVEGHLRTRAYERIVFVRSPSLLPRKPTTPSTSSPDTPVQVESPVIANLSRITASMMAIIPKKDHHPIQDVFTALLQSFSARYKLLEPEAAEQQEKEPEQLALPLGRISAKAWQRAAATTPTLVAAKSPSVNALKALAQVIETHERMSALLIRSLGSTQWPTDDRVPDQLDPNYKPNKLEKDAEKRSADEEPQGVEQPSSKRRRVARRT
ncbi:hypothetical protein FKP32DRAFT_1652984 [Trametes sanguinea]|nr:hypothetical protein FKP32DRAFT_1652984 [Trametes sanguinea]